MTLFNQQMSIFAKTIIYQGTSCHIINSDYANLPFGPLQQFSWPWLHLTSSQTTPSFSPTDPRYHSISSGDRYPFIPPAVCSLLGPWFYVYSFLRSCFTSSGPSFKIFRPPFPRCSLSAMSQPQFAPTSLQLFSAAAPPLAPPPPHGLCAHVRFPSCVPVAQCSFPAMHSPAALVPYTWPLFPVGSFVLSLGLITPPLSTYLPYSALPPCTKLISYCPLPLSVLLSIIVGCCCSSFPPII